MTKTILTVFLLASPLMAQQDQAAAAFAAAGCGQNEVQFDVKTDKKQHPLPQPAPGKAMVYVLEEDFAAFCIGGCITTRVGVDGAWVGANQGKSYLFFIVDPGDHRVCTAWQSSLKGRSQVSAAISLTAEAGKSYYFRTFVFNGALKLKQVDSANGPLLILSSALSTSQPKQPAVTKNPDSD